MKSIRSDIYFLALLVPFLLLLFFVMSGNPIWGDAPYFHEEGLKELVAEPFVWTTRGNSFGGINKFLWISPVMIVYGLFSTIFGLNSNTILLLLFYFPSLMLSFLGPILLTRSLGFSKKTQFLTSFFYVCNTYYLLLLDGGQVGVALGYAIVPFAVLSIKTLFNKASVVSFVVCLSTLFLLGVVDPRIMILSLFLSLAILEVRNIKYLLVVLVSLLFLNLYWLVPIFSLGTEIGKDLSSSVNFSRLLNILFLFQPHWPANEFGKVSYPPFYFVGLPLIALFAFYRSKKNTTKRLFVSFLLFAFLAKGDSPPFGEIYKWAVTSIPFTFVFRDSSKFFIPLIFIAGLLIGESVEQFKNTKIRNYYFTAVFLYLFVLVSPAFFGRLNFVLSNREHDGSINRLSLFLKEESSFLRTAYFPEKHPLSFHTESSQALDAKDISLFRPFASMNAGSSDLFNFLNNKDSEKWLSLFSVRYLAFSGNSRKSLLNSEEKRDWDNLLSLISSKDGLKKVEEVKMPVYEITNTKPQMYSADKAFLLVGGDDVSNPSAPFIYLEDGIVNPYDLQRIASDSAYLVFNKKKEVDLTFSLLQKYFVSVSDNKKTEWSVWGKESYLKWKFELLIRGIDTKEFDYSKGIAFSSIPNEEIEFEISTKKSGEYIFGARAMSTKASKPLLISVNGKEFFFGEADNFSWNTGVINLTEGKTKVKVLNREGLWVLNVLALIPKEEWDKAVALTNNFVNQFNTVNMNEVFTMTQKETWKEVQFEKNSPVRYKVTVPQDANWVLLSDRYHPGWKLRRGIDYFDSYPVFSSLNLFNTNKNWKDTEIVFVKQQNVRWGIYFTVISFVTLSICLLWLYSADKKNI